MKPNYKGWREGCVMLSSTKDGIFAHSLSALLVRADTSDRKKKQLSSCGGIRGWYPRLQPNIIRRTPGARFVRELAVFSETSTRSCSSTESLKTVTESYTGTSNCPHQKAPLSQVSPVVTHISPPRRASPFPPP